MPSDLRKKKDTERKTQTRTTLIDAASIVIQKQGYHKTLISDIVKEANCAQGTFYQHFKNKHELFEVMMDEFVEGLLDKFADMAIKMPSDLGEYRESSTNAIKRFANVMAENQDTAQMFIKEAPAIDDYFEKKLDKLISQFVELAKFYLDHAIESGFARKCNSFAVANAIVGIGLWTIKQWWSGGFGETSVDDLVQELSDLVFYGVGVDV